jgi:hypothetical protein
MPAVEQGVSVVLRRIVEGPPLFYVGSGGGKLSAPEQGRPQRVVSLQDECSVAHLLG